jgi:hypothetical protein
MSFETDFDNSRKVVIELRALCNRGPEFTEEYVEGKINEMLHEIEKDGQVIWVRWNFEKR